MSWRVESLLLNRHVIREIYFDETYIVINSPTRKHPGRMSDKTEIYKEYNPYADSYDDLLFVEIKIDELVLSGIIDEIELKILNMVIESNTFKTVAKDLNLSHITVAKYFHKTCSKIAFYLGGRWTDVGYIEYMKDKYNLDETQMERMVKYMVSEYKHRLITRKQEDKGVSNE